MSSVITSISINTAFRIRGIPVASMSAPVHFTIVRGDGSEALVLDAGGRRALADQLAADKSWQMSVFCLTTICAECAGM